MQAQRRRQPGARHPPRERPLRFDEVRDPRKRAESRDGVEPNLQPVHLVAAARGRRNQAGAVDFRVENEVVRVQVLSNRAQVLGARRVARLLKRLLEKGSLGISKEHVNRSAKPRRLAQEHGFRGHARERIQRREIDVLVLAAPRRQRSRRVLGLALAKLAHKLSKRLLLAWHAPRRRLAFQAAKEQHVHKRSQNRRFEQRVKPLPAVLAGRIVRLQDHLEGVRRRRLRLARGRRVEGVGVLLELAKAQATRQPPQRGVLFFRRGAAQVEEREDRPPQRIVPAAEQEGIGVRQPIFDERVAGFGASRVLFHVQPRRRVRRQVVPLHLRRREVGVEELVFEAAQRRGRTAERHRDVVVHLVCENHRRDRLGHRAADVADAGADDHRVW